MKSDVTGKPSGTNLAKLLALADEDIALDDDTPYDPNDPAAVEAFWKNAIVTPGGGVRATLAALRRARGPARKPRKTQLTVRYSPEVWRTSRPPARAGRTDGRGAQGVDRPARGVARDPRHPCRLRLRPLPGRGHPVRLPARRDQLGAGRRRQPIARRGPAPAKIGRLFWFVSVPLERRFGHRTLTHSAVALLAVAVLAAPLWLVQPSTTGRSSAATGPICGWIC